MSTQFSFSSPATKIQNLQAQYKYLLLLQEHHLLWSKQTQDPEIVRMHHDIDDLLTELEERYQVLLGSLRAGLDLEAETK